MGGGGKESSSQQSTSYTPEQREGQKAMFAAYLPTIGKNNNVFQGERVAGFNPSQTKVFDFANQGGFRTTPNQVQDYFTNTIKNPAVKQYNEIVSPAVKEAYSGPGYWSSARAKAEADASKDLADNLNTEWGKLNWDTLNANRQGALQEYQLGEAQQKQKQNEIDAAMNKFKEEGLLTDPVNTEILLSLLGMNYSTSKQSSSGWDVRIA